MPILAPQPCGQPAPPADPLAALRADRDQLQILVDVTNAVLSTLQLEELAEKVAQALQLAFGVSFVGLNLHAGDDGELQTHDIYLEREGRERCRHTSYPRERLPAREAMLGRQLLLASEPTLEQMAAVHPRFADVMRAGCRSLCVLPLCGASGTVGALLLAYPGDSGYFRAVLPLLQQVAARLTLGLDNALAYQEISRLKDQLASENLQLTSEIQHYQNFDEIIGHSAAMSAVLEQVEIVAASDCSVLLLGETGTGKELIARAIHAHSPRAGKRMVNMNCAAIPAGLLESELFGHEKGAFTGATAQRLGRFEMADQSTLFLDEVGDIPLELQPKLLRVLQEREVERLGGQKIIPVDVRLISATSCDLMGMIADKRYRSDLYYQLNVFPILLPPLRDRPDDIPLLAQFFTQKFARRMNRCIESIPAETLQRLQRHNWPGNVRELQNVIERAVILTRGPVLNLPQTDLAYHQAAPSCTPPAAPARRETPLFDACEPEKERILRVLKECNGIVAGPRGAAAKLGLKRTTLLSRMQRLGISSREPAES
jgi:formate hydrogenlyase transcriptional activator